jgi:hypothetical protein
VPPEVITTDTTSESTSHYSELIRFLRSRNIEFDIKGLRPLTKFYSFFEGIDVSSYITPKLLEIQMVSGRFRVGETVESDPHFTTGKIKFRVCTPNHRTGLHNAPSEIYKLNPYTQREFEINYSETSTVLNVDTRALQLQSEVDFYGSVSTGMKLIGKTSGAVATVREIRLISDNQGRLIGSLFVPDPNVPGNPKWINGENTFTVIDVSTLTQSSIDEFISNTRVNQSSAEAEFSSSGEINTTDINLLTTRNIKIIPSRNINTTTITNTTTNSTTFSGQSALWESSDPLAQSFYVREETGIFLTSVDVFFETKDDTIPVTLQIRPMVAGAPSNMVVPLSEVTLDPDQINLSTDGSVSTKFEFVSPIYLPGPQQLNVRSAPIGSQQTSEFAIVLLSNSPQYRVFIAEIGKRDIQTNVQLSQQPTLGSLFKSQNGSTWSPAQLEDLKYRINRAEFKTEGLVRMFNPVLSLGNGKVTVTGENQFQPLSKKIVVGLGSTGYNFSEIVPGITITQGTASGTLTGIGGSISVGTGVTVTNAGFGYTPSSGSYTFNAVNLKTETGYGQGATANVTVSSGLISSVTITNGGNGYQVGDSLIVPDLGKNVGFGGKVVVESISSNNTFVLDKVQGTFNVGISTLYYKNSSGITTVVGSGVTASSITPDQYYTGTHMKIYHMNHGMHSTENYVKISSVRPAQTETNSKTTSALTVSSLSIPLISAAGFETFEGVGVSTSNPGYAIIGNEIVEYTSVAANTLTLSQRGIDDSEIQSYDINIPVYKYEFNGISLRRINKVHNFAEIDDSTIHQIDLNSYFIKIDMGQTDFDGKVIGTNRENDLYFKETIQTGRTGALLTNNIQFEAITPNIAYILPAKTNLTSKIRTFSGTSVSGNETSFVDNGYNEIPLNQTTYFNAPNLICSEINESRFITESPGNRSLSFEFLMSSSDSRVSPVIDTIRTSAILTSNLINSPVGIETSGYANDDSIRSLYNDKHSTIYISSPIGLKLPANSIKVLFSASRNNLNDIRVLYQIFRADSPYSSQNYELFPGYSNYYIDGQGIKRVLDASLNDGSADSKIVQTSDRSFKDYEYSVDDLPDFTAFAIKIVMASENQATPPIIKDLRAIATVKPRV